MLHVCYYENMYCVIMSSFPFCLWKKPKQSNFKKQVQYLQEQLKISNYKYLGVSNRSEEIQNLTQKVGELESKLEEETRQTPEDTLERLHKVQTHGFFPFI